MNKETIFVSIPTMNDSEYIPTLERLFESAKYPDRITVGSSIFWKKEDLLNTNAPFFYFLDKKISSLKSNIKYDILYWNDYPGLGYGRTEPLKHYNNEKYYLSLDPHTVFVNSWDEKLIEEYEDAKKDFGRRIVLTTYLPPYYLKEDFAVALDEDAFCSTIEELDITECKDIVFEKNDFYPRWQFFDYNGPRNQKLLNKKDIFPKPNDISINKLEELLFNNLIKNKYLPAKKISAHFTFTEANPWVSDFRLNLDPRVQFWLEEFYQSSLSYARGYNLVWTKNTFFFHRYLMEGVGSRSHQTKYEYESLEEKNIFYKKYMNNIGNKNNITINENELIAKLLLSEEYFGYLPRSTTSFQKYSGVDVDLMKCEPWWKVPEIDIIYK